MISIVLLVLAGYLVTSDGVEIDIEGKGVIVDQVTNTGEGLENEVIDFNRPEMGYS